MAGPSAISWTEQTWNPVVGCSILTPGCTNCYAMRAAWRKHRMKALPHYHGLTKKVKGNPVWTGKLAMAPDSILLAPLKRKKPTLYFVNSMGDLFHEDCPDEWIDRVFAVMALSPQHTFQVLTKRAARMRKYFERYNASNDHNCADMIADAAAGLLGKPGARGADRYNGKSPGWPLPNVWLGVSCERQQEADARIPLLLQTPAAVRFISAEPLLGPIDLKRWMPTGKWGTFKGEPVYHQTYFMTKCEHCGWFGSSELCRLSYNADDADVVCPACTQIFICDEVDAKLHWVIAGGESGPKARPMHPDWPRALRDQCKAAGVAYHFKQWGEFHPSDQHDPEQCKQDKTPDAVHISGKREFRPSEQFRLIGGRVEGWAGMCRVGKAKAGRLLDGVEHNEFPRTPT